MDIEHEDVILKDRGIKNGIQKFIVVDKSTNKENGIIFKTQ